MKKELFKILPLIALMGINNVYAEYMIKIPLEQNQGGTLPNDSVSITGKWSNTSTVYGEWLDQGHPYNCISWSPAASTITIGETFTQTASDCTQDQTRTAQDQEVETISGIIRDKGEPYTQSRTITVSSTRDSVGTLETWVATDSTYTDWVNSEEIYGCTNWSPAASTKPQGESFTQTATDCEQNQTRTRQDRQQETTTLAYRNVGSPVTETNILYNKTNTRPATGTLVTYKYDSSNYAECSSMPAPPPNVHNMHTIYYNGVKVYSNTMTFSSYHCAFSTGAVINGYTIGQKMTSSRWAVKKN